MDRGFSIFAQNFWAVFRRPGRGNRSDNTSSRISLGRDKVKTMSNATVLQTAANRFSRVASFSPITVDGNIGPNTLNAVQRALGYLAVDMGEAGGWVSETVSDDAATWSAKANTAARLGAYALPIGSFLTDNANRLNLPNVAGPMPSGGGGSFVPPTVSPITLSPTTTSLLDRFKMLAPWQKIVFGALAGIGLIWAWGYFKKARGLPTIQGLGATKLYLFTYRNKHNTWSDVWARDVDDARDKIRRKKNTAGFFEISRVTNVPPREVA